VLIWNLELYTLIVDPRYQRRGIGAMLLEDGLKDADNQNLQCTLGALPEGLGKSSTHLFLL